MMKTSRYLYQIIELLNRELSNVFICVEMEKEVLYIMHLERG